MLAAIIATVYFIMFIILVVSIKGIRNGIKIHNRLQIEQIYDIPSLNGKDEFQKKILRRVIAKCPFPVHEIDLVSVENTTYEKEQKALQSAITNGWIVQDGKYYTLPRKGEE
jgi:hypothetical protein